MLMPTGERQRRLSRITPPRTLRNAIRLTDWLLWQTDYPETQSWFDD